MAARDLIGIGEAKNFQHISVYLNLPIIQQETSLLLTGKSYSIFFIPIFIISVLLLSKTFKNNFHFK